MAKMKIVKYCVQCNEQIYIGPNYENAMARYCKECKRLNNNARVRKGRSNRKWQSANR